MRYDLTNLDSHVVATKFYMAMLALEKLPGSKEQTAAVEALKDCRNSVQRFMNETADER